MVKPSGRDGVSAGFRLEQHLDKPEGLAGFVEAPGRFSRDLGAVFRDFQQLHLPLGVCLLLGHVQGQHRIPVGIGNGGIAADNHCVEEMAPSGVIRVAGPAGGKGRLCLGRDTIEPDGQNLLIFYGKVADAVVKVVARCEDVVFHGSEGFLGHIGSGELTGGFSLPIRVYAP